MPPQGTKVRAASPGMGMAALLPCGGKGVRRAGLEGYGPCVTVWHTIGGIPGAHLLWICDRTLLHWSTSHTPLPIVASLQIVIRRLWGRVEGGLELDLTTDPNDIRIHKDTALSDLLPTGAPPRSI